ncbi:unnamed protein product [Protopolystoma xenopodis]|uniref:Uncharacterized protein n=1 Tax=Protopolystoma xenopodis TaxID=117903 RepID=A0A448WLR4_9PLAT|nr:unnamed protein product [Protopolystoma xenopodis]
MKGEASVNRGDESRPLVSLGCRKQADMIVRQTGFAGGRFVDEYRDYVHVAGGAELSERSRRPRRLDQLKHRQGNTYTLLCHQVTHTVELSQAELSVDCVTGRENTAPDRTPLPLASRLPQLSDPGAKSAVMRGHDKFNLWLPGHANKSTRMLCPEVHASRQSPVASRQSLVAFHAARLAASTPGPVFGSA